MSRRLTSQDDCGVYVCFEAVRLQRIRKEEKGLICVKTYNITKDSTEKKLEYEKSYLNYDIALHHGVVSDDGIRSIIRFQGQNLFQFNG